jgi:hypothetical protein
VGEPKSSTHQPANAQITAPAELANAGVIAYEDGDYSRSVAQLSEAYRALRAPSIGLWLGRGLMKLGHLVEAAVILHEVQQLSPDVGKVEVQRNAQAEAAQEEANLLPRVPRITLTFQPDDAPTRVMLDGQVIDARQPNESHLVNPGQHDIAWLCNGADKRRSVSIAERDTQTIRVECADATKQARPNTTTIARAPQTKGATPANDARRPASAQRIATWAALGLGGAGLVIGTISGIVALGEKSDLDAIPCPNNRCEGHQDEVNSLNRWRNVSTGGFVVGAVGLAAGATLWLTTPKDETAGSVAVLIGPQSLAVSGRF